MRKNITVAVVLAVIAAAFTAASAQATFTCSGTHQGVTINENVTVPQGATCRLTGSSVNGNIQVRSGGALVLNGTDVSGNVQSIGARFIRITNRSQIGGATQIIRTTGTPPSFTANAICGSTLSGGLQLNQNSAPFAIGDASQCNSGNTFGASVQITNNSAQVLVSHNRIQGNLQCAGNHPPAAGGNNTVSGIKQGEGCS